MSPGVLALKMAALGGLVASASYVHFRGRVRHSFLRQLTDHSTFFAPVNALVYPTPSSGAAGSAST
jgi:beta-hydroxylase